LDDVTSDHRPTPEVDVTKAMKALGISDSISSKVTRAKDRKKGKK